jgi:hypothetical protein
MATRITKHGIREMAAQVNECLGTNYHIESYRPGYQRLYCLYNEGNSLSQHMVAKEMQQFLKGMLAASAAVYEVVEPMTTREHLDRQRIINALKGTNDQTQRDPIFA